MRTDRNKDTCSRVGTVLGVNELGEKNERLNTGSRGEETDNEPTNNENSDVGRERCDEADNHDDKIRGEDDFLTPIVVRHPTQQHCSERPTDEEYGSGEEHYLV